ncbi:MAG: mechanosensitive ion channel [Phycisphaeraceae bacterium]|nr:mechanosensitive ion channel [Phycisphaeraceae bacterium]
MSNLSITRWLAWSLGQLPGVCLLVAVLWPCTIVWAEAEEPPGDRPPVEIADEDEDQSEPDADPMDDDPSGSEGVGEAEAEAEVEAQEEGMIAPLQRQARRAALRGAWLTSVGDRTVTLTLKDDGTFRLGSERGRYTVEEGQLLLQADTGRASRFDYRLEEEQLHLSGGDLLVPLVFSREYRTGERLSDLLNIAPEAMRQRIYRIGVIIAIVAVSHLIIVILRWLSHIVIFSEWGPLALIYRRHKNRIRTLHSLVLNVIKYFIYFTALGMILSELGINYMTYIASLSVIGLAIGFGSQGLVQDMVTGFFIIFEGQFDVGDMVEVAGQVGVVTELGLRMTKLRNYQGQIVVVPNRNIATVGNFFRGAQRAYIDVAVESPDAGRAVMPLLRQLGEEVMRQFEGVVMGPLRATGPMSLQTGEYFVRLHLSIWPNQTWVVDQQVIPRLREMLKRHDIANPADRILVYYYAREIVAVTGLHSRRAGRGTPTKA